jgi:alpha-L-rhamnosidase
MHEQGLHPPVNLKCENRIQPLNIDTLRPRLSWILQSPARTRKQSAYRILVASDRAILDQEQGDLWDSSRVDSNDSTYIDYNGLALESGMACHWKVRVWDDQDHQSAWSEPAMWTMGLLDPADWKAQWIGAGWTGDWQENASPPLPWLRRIFTLDEIPARASAHVSTLGYHELYINGRKVDDSILTPAVCDYEKRALYRTHDITSLLVEGRNCIALWLGRGWYVRGMPGVIHDGPLVAAQVDVEFPGGRNMRITTDTDWRLRPSPITPIGGVGHQKYGGEQLDTAKEIPDWNLASLDDSSWENAQRFDPPIRVPTPQQVEPNRIRETIHPLQLEKLEDGSFLVDMGRHFTGWFEIGIETGEEPPPVVMEYIDQRRGEELVAYGQRDEWIIQGSGRHTFCNRFSYHGFRWVKITGLDRPPKLENIRGFMIQSDYPPAAQFECSDPLLNQIYETTLWTFRCLTLGGYIVDCPHRERLGYGGDGQSSMETGLASFGVGNLYRKWLMDWRDIQDPETGDLPHTAPRGPYFAGGGPAWGGICTTLPWEVYLYTGDRRVLEENDATIRNWLEFLESKCRDGLLRHYGHEEWGFLGDWVPPGRGQGPDERIDDTSTLMFNNCHYLLNLQLGSRIAKILDDPVRAVAYHDRAARLRRAIHEGFFRPDTATYANGEQPYLALALLLEIVPASERARVENNLEHDIRVTRDGHLNSGMLGTYYLLKYLTDAGRSDLVLAMAMKKDCPGWGFMLEQGATTIWEQWDGVHSHIHNCMLSIGAWFIQGLAGIRPDPDAPGFEHFFVKPAGIDELDSVNATYDSVRGRIEVHWRRDGDRLDLELAIPVNSTATLHLPASGVDQVTESGRPAGEAPGVQWIENLPGLSVFRLDSGHHKFTSGCKTPESMN